ncbi:trypsin-like serine protease [Lentzea sp. NEAU-D13]|uniref:Trypsin-like serine protease n=1 Tax=Lentzea alba TaxID=2714351 RepID=A0A7C9S0D5_9PSEU|nr:trypsin-like serine protease [Lentzea alba]NGY65703.1 trypsin-like serine protease [Lentzea alba]
MLKTSWFEWGTCVWGLVGRSVLAALVSVLAAGGIFPATASAIVGGQEVTQEYPWAVVVEYSQGACSGALIAPRWVLTAGHCIVTARPDQAENDPGLDNPLREAADVRLYVGATARYEGQARRANRLVKGPAGLDVGLIELDRASDKAPIQVAAPMTPSGGQQGLLVAWGQVCAEKDCAVSQTLKQLPVNLSPAAGVTAADSELLTWPMEDPQQQAAKGDSGGPIVTQIDGQPQLVGTLSGSGTSSNSSAQKGLATNVTSVRRWLDETTSTTTPETSSWSVEFILAVVLGGVVVLVVIRSFWRLHGRKRQMMPSTPMQKARDEDLDHLEQWALRHSGVEAYFEPGAATIVATIMLIAGDGEWTRRKIGSLEAAFRFGNKCGIPVYEVFRTGYPQRKRDYDERSRRPKALG